MSFQTRLDYGSQFFPGLDKLHILIPNLLRDVDNILDRTKYKTAVFS